MIYRSTRDNGVRVTAAQAIARGISPEGGLYLPTSLPKLDAARLDVLAKMDYRGRALNILGDFLDDFDQSALAQSIASAYGSGFASEKVTPIVSLCPGTYMLELWHGPTCAFKDLALQLLPYLVTQAAQKEAGGKTVNILVATSGDTGKAALEGFKDAPGTNILVFYPRDGVSRVQELQMTTQQGGNVGVCGVHGNFDDTQAALKKIFTNLEIKARLDAKNAIFSSANSINWGRLAPQIVYYVSAYCELVKGGELAPGEKLNIAVPTGNFGNILAAYYAKKMGLPVGKLICASNRNNVLADFISTGVYDKRREFFTTSSPSMDILVSSNLERLLHALTGEDDAAVTGFMSALGREGVYTLPAQMLDALKFEFYGDFCDETETAETIKGAFQNHNYLCDPHTAVALKVYRDYVEKTGDATKTLIASTASPFKFVDSVLTALTGQPGGDDEFAQLRELSSLAGIPLPPQITELESLPVRFEQTCEKEEMERVVLETLGL
ncbi:MAG: threonine synthase [Oscillospiraceae bacterium]|nr:threonine synthase [Oscillospiraceae bacterium]